MEVIATVMMIAGVLVAAVAGVWFLVVAFRQGVLWGLGCMFLPFVSLVFLVMHWDKAARPFLIKVAALVPVFLGAFLAGMLEA
ncbi:MAG TPA: hypothetical protein PLQ13_07925 [Candidatus Krumholzibacteria bacterium]|nr:hypothetical protein [Candidatus Krumholzibacteria bacterium]